MAIVTEVLRIAFIALLVGLLCAIDAHTPLGIGVGMLYAGIVFLSATSSYRRLPLITATVASLLIPMGAAAAPIVEGFPIWIGIANHTLSLGMVWIGFWFVQYRRRVQDDLQQARDVLEVRVQERTAELAQVNKALVAEITERIETAASLRTSETALEASQQALQRSEDDLRALAARLLTAQEEERRRISRDLHDDINQRLAMIVVELETIERAYPSAPISLASRIRSLQDNVAELSEDLRHIAYQFHPSVLDDLGLPIALRRLVDDFSVRTGVTCRFQEGKEWKSIPQPAATCLYRIAQEALSNVAKHANATLVELELSRVGGMVSLMVRDNGVGFDSAHHRYERSSLGLVSMHERVHLVKGKVDLESRPGQGTIIRTNIPLEDVHA